MTCMCGDTECPSCGLAQGTLDERDALREKLEATVAFVLRLLSAECATHSKTASVEDFFGCIMCVREERDALRESAKAAERLLCDVQARTEVLDDEIDAYFAKYAMLTERAVEVPCLYCLDGNRWTREGPAGLCTFCHGTGIHPSREGD